MAKRGAENQISKDDDERRPGEEDVVEGVRDEPLAPVEGRVIRGMPKKRGGTVTPGPQPSVSASTSTATPFSSFSFGSGSGAGTGPNPFAFSASSVTKPAFGAAETTAAPSASNLSQATDPAPAATSGPFSFGNAAPTSAEAPKSSSPFSFGGASQAAKPAAQTPAPPKPFAGFSFSKPVNSSASSSSGSGFGTSTTNPSTSSFGFGAKPVAEEVESEKSTEKAAPTILTTAATSTPSIFGSSASTNVPAAAAYTSSFVPPAASATNGVASTAPSAVTAPKPTQPEPPSEKEVAYYSALRGLNVSILSFLSRSLESDPFLDLTVALPDLTKQYGSYLDEAAGNAGWRPEGSRPSTTTMAKTDAQKPNGAVAPPKMPALPSTGNFNLLPQTPSNGSPAGPSSGGFMFKPSAAASTSSPFTLGGSSSTGPASKPEAVKPSADLNKFVEDAIADEPAATSSQSINTDAPKPFTFALPASSSSEPKKTGSLFSFAPSGPLHPPTPDSKTFSPSTTLESGTTPPSKLGRFGPGGSQPQLAFGGAKSSPGTASSGSSKPVGFSFGPSGGSGFSIGSDTGNASTSAPAPASSSFSFGSTSTAITGFSFGAGAKPSEPSKPSLAFSFASKPAGDASASSSKPTPTFSFGSTPAPTNEPPQTFGSSTPSSFSFAPKSTTEELQVGGDESTKDSTAENTPDPTSPSKNLAQLSGVGEENEETVLQVRAKLYHFVDGANTLDGLGVFKIKRSLEDGKKRRLLMRTDGGGNIILNMSLTKHVNPTSDGTWVKFLGFDQKGKAAPYSMKVKTSEKADEVVEVLKKEVEDL